MAAASGGAVHRQLIGAWRPSSSASRSTPALSRLLVKGIAASARHACNRVGHNAGALTIFPLEVVPPSSAYTLAPSASAAGLRHPHTVPAFRNVVSGKHAALVAADHAYVAAHVKSLLVQVVQHHDLDVGDLHHDVDHVRRHLRRAAAGNEQHLRRGAADRLKWVSTMTWRRIRQCSASSLLGPPISSGSHQPSRFGLEVVVRCRFVHAIRPAVAR